MCVATSSSRHNYDIKVAKHKGLFESFDFIVTGDDVALGQSVHYYIINKRILRSDAIIRLEKRKTASRACVNRKAKS